MNGRTDTVSVERLKPATPYGPATADPTERLTDGANTAPTQAPTDSVSTKFPDREGRTRSGQLSRPTVRFSIQVLDDIVVFYFLFYMYLFLYVQFLH